MERSAKPASISHLNRGNNPKANHRDAPLAALQPTWKFLILLLKEFFNQPTNKTRRRAISVIAGADRKGTLA